MLQADGNLVLYNLATNSAEWASGTSGKSVAYAVVQGDGNLVLIDQSGNVAWASKQYRELPLIGKR